MPHQPTANLGNILFRRLRWPMMLLLMVYTITILGFVLIPGQDDQGNVWRMDFFHAFYFVSFMGSTIGFGEIPYEFTAPQRMWAIVGIYGTVIAWLYGIGSLLTTIQDPKFRRMLREQRFRRSVASMKEPFYLICGYGDTGRLLVKALTEEHIRSVVVDISDERIDAVVGDQLEVDVPALQGDASETHILQAAGLSHEHCLGVVAITNEDQINLTVALTTYLLEPERQIIARAETSEAVDNITSFGANIVINPFETFAGRLSMALHSPGMYTLYEWLTEVPDEDLRDPLFPPGGNWILCGFGRFGKAVSGRLENQGINTTIVEANPEQMDNSNDYIKGTGTKAKTLHEAGIMNATGIVAGTDDDADNLSILLTAREVNPNLFMVARQNSSRNDAIYQKAKIDLVMRRGSVIAHKIYAFIRTPLLNTFLNRARQHDNDWANRLVSRISAITPRRFSEEQQVYVETVPHLWEYHVNTTGMPGYFQRRDEIEVSIGDMLRNPKDREEKLQCLPLLHKRGHEETLLPDEFTPLQSGDKMLFCGTPGAHRQMDWSALNGDVLSYVATGEEHPSTYLGRWMSVLSKRKKNGSDTTT